MWPLRTMIAGVLSLTAVASCGKRPSPEAPEAPEVTERRPLIASVAAPLLNEMEEDEPVAAVGRAGDVVEVVEELGTLEWEGLLGEAKGKRDGRVVEVRQGPGDSILFGFQADLGPEVEVPTTAWICDAIARDRSIPAARLPECAARLRRLRMPDGAFAAYLLCSRGPCPVAVVREGRATAVGLEGLVFAKWVTAGNRLLLLGRTRWAGSDGAVTGGRLVPVDLSGQTPVALPPIELDAIDRRDPAKIVTRVVHPAITEGERATVHLVGHRRENAREGGRELTRSPIDETIPLDGR